MNTIVNQTFQCTFCSKNYSDKKSLRFHISTCQLSDDEEKKFENQRTENLSPSINVNSSRKNFKKCVVCDQMINEDEYYLHMDDCGIQSSSTTEKVKKKKICQTCSLEIDEMDYVDHITQCSVNKSMKKCPTCSQNFEENKYVGHVSQCTNVTKTKQCQTCNQKIPEEDFVDHIDQCQSKPPPKLSKTKQCQTCDQKIPEEDFVDHIDQCVESRPSNQTTVRRDPTGECPMCFKQFPSDQLQEHAGRCNGGSSNASSMPSAASVTSKTCFTCSAPITTLKSSYYTGPCRAKHMYCIKCLEKSMSKHLELNTPPVCDSNLCNHELSRYDIFCLPLDKTMKDRLIPLVKSTERPQCPLCHYYIDIKTIDDFNRHANSCIDNRISCDYCQCLYNENEINDHTRLCVQSEVSTQQQAFHNFILSRTKYPMTIHELRVFLNERKKDHLPTDPLDIVNALAKFDGVFPYEIAKRECDICTDSFAYDDIFVFGCDESHKLCYDCFAESTANKMKNNETLTCAMCNYQLQDGEIKQLRIPAEQKRQYIDYQTDKTFNEFTGGQGILKCPNKGCKWIAQLTDPNDRFKVTCEACKHEFCSLCSQQYHYRTTCQEMPELTQRWFFWCNTERGNYWQARAQQDATYRAQLEDYQRQTAANEQRNEELRQRYNELVADEQYKAQNCRLCPNCRRLVQKLDGCDSMICGRNYHGGDQQSGCGQGFRWSQATPYVPMDNRGPQQVAINIAAPEQQQLVVHRGVQCDACHNEVRGIRFDCVHCPSLIFCEKCEQRASLEHSNQIRAENKPQHIFQVITTAENANARL